MPRLHGQGDGYGHARMPRGAAIPEPERIDRVPYGRFRNVYLYITEACQLRCEHCYMGERLDRALKMPLPRIIDTLATWRRLGGSKLTVLGGEPTLHPDYCTSIRAAKQLGYEHVITTTNAQAPALRKFRQLEPEDFAYVQVSLDGGSPSSHDAIRGAGTFNSALTTTAELTKRGFDTRIICTVNQANREDALQLLDIVDELGVSLVKFHVFSTIGIGHGNPGLAMTPPEWVEFCDHLNQVAKDYRTRVWYQPTYARRDQMERYQAEGYQGCACGCTSSCPATSTGHTITAGPMPARSCVASTGITCSETLSWTPKYPRVPSRRSRSGRSMSAAPTPCTTPWCTPLWPSPTASQWCSAARP